MSIGTFATDARRIFKMALNSIWHNPQTMSIQTTVNVLDQTVSDAQGQAQSLGQYKGKVMLIANVASKCGLTPQYAGLEALYKKYQDQGLMVLGFPCNQFGGQEPGTMDEILTFCSNKYDVSFPIMGKLEVNGPNRAPLYAKLTSVGPTDEIGWNFEKFVVGKDGNVVARFAPQTKPDDPAVVKAIEDALALNAKQIDLIPKQKEPHSCAALFVCDAKRPRPEKHDLTQRRRFAVCGG